LGSSLALRRDAIQRKGVDGGPCPSAPEEEDAQGPGPEVGPQQQLGEEVQGPWQEVGPEQQPDEDGTATAKAAADAAPPSATSIAAPSTSGGSPLPAATRSFMDPRFGQDFSGVRVHADGEADTLSRAIGADAFTFGSDIYFRAGRFRPSTEAG